MATYYLEIQEEEIVRGDVEELAPQLRSIVARTKDYYEVWLLDGTLIFRDGRRAFFAAPPEYTPPEAWKATARRAGSRARARFPIDMLGVTDQDVVWEMEFSDFIAHI